MKEFVTAVQAVEDQDENAEGWVEFKVDGVVCHARRPTPGQVAYLTANLHKNAPLDRQISGAINFCVAIMDVPSRSYISDKLLDSDDPFDLPEIQAIIEYLIEEWSGGRPTEPSSDSSESQDSTGEASTPGPSKNSSNAASIAS